MTADRLEQIASLLSEMLGRVDRVPEDERPEFDKAVQQLIDELDELIQSRKKNAN